MINRIVWLFVGSLWYAAHDGFSWWLAYYTSVDIGLSITWSETRYTPDAFYSTSSKIFSMIHLSVGVIFEVAIVFLIAKQIIKKKGDWIHQAMHRSNLSVGDSATVCERVHSFYALYLNRYRVVLRTFLIGFVGVVWFSNTISTMTIRSALDYMVSAMTGAGYVSLPKQTAWWQYIIAATLTGLGRPVLSIAIGKIYFLHISSDCQFCIHSL